MKSCQRHLSLQSLWTLLLTVTLITLTQHSSTFTASALRHTFSVKHDTRFFIGPISTPYGFNENGEYKLTVSKFRVRVSSSSSSSRKNTDPTPEQMFEEIKGLHPGFLLKKFNNENQFNRFMDEILDNPDKCGFGDLMSYLDDNFEVDNGFFENKHDHNSNGISEVGDDDTVSPKSSSVIVDKMVARGPGVVDGGKDGIFLSMNHPKMWKPEEPTLFHTFTAEEAGYYFLFYQICLEPDVSKSGKKDKFLFRELQSTFHLDFDYVNKDALGNRTYLTAGEVMLPHLYLYFSVSYALLLFLWVRSLRGDGNGGFGGTGGRVTVYAIHHLMSAVLALKTLSIFFESLRYHFIRVNGHAELWSFIYYLFTFVKGTFLFTLILLLGSGWSFFKPFLKPKERRIIYFVFILQVIDNIAVVVLTHETLGERLYSDWSAVLHLVDIVSCCAILIPIVWQVNALEQSLDQQTPVGDVLYVDNDNSNSNLDTSDGNDDQNPEMEGGVVLDGESTRLKEKLDLFRSFYLTVVAYIYFTRIVVYLLASALSYNHTWWRYLIAELGTLLFYVTIGIKFRPRVESPGYSTILQNEDDFENGAIVRSKQNNLEMSSMVSSAQAQGGKQA